MAGKAICPYLGAGYNTQEDIDALVSALKNLLTQAAV
jgi:hypothetical protein